MSCYFRHLKEVLSEAGIEVNKTNRKQVDAAIHNLVGVEYKDCPNAWKKLKQEILNSPQKREEFIGKLRHAVS